MICVAEKKEHRDEQTEEYVLIPLYSMYFFRRDVKIIYKKILFSDLDILYRRYI